MHGVNMRHMKPATSEKDPRSPALQGANARRLFMKLRWLMEQHDVNADRVINIDEGAVYCRCKRSAGAVEARHKRSSKAKSEEATSLTAAFGVDRDPLEMLLQILHAEKTTAVLPQEPFPPHSLRTFSENGSAISSTTVELAIASDGVINPAGHSRAWILLWEMASVHASEVTLCFHEGVVASCRVVFHCIPKHFVLAAFGARAAQDVLLHLVSIYAHNLVGLVLHLVCVFFTNL